MATEEKPGLLREIFSGGDGQLSSFRIMAMLGMVSGCIALLAQAFGAGCGTDLTGALIFLFGGALGGKVGQKYVEGRKP